MQHKIAFKFVQQVRKTFHAPNGRKLQNRRHSGQSGVKCRNRNNIKY